MAENVQTLVEQLRKASDRVDECRYCPAYTVCPTGTVSYEGNCLFSDAADLIVQFTAKLEQVKRELDLATGYLREIVDCESCAYLSKKTDEEPCVSCRGGYLTNQWEWRGINTENGGNADA